MQSFNLFNIKSFKTTGEISLKKLNIFVGRNSSGKSSLVRFPVILKQTFGEEVYTPLLLFGNLIDYGNFDDVIYNHEGDIIEFSISFDSKDIRKYWHYGGGGNIFSNRVRQQSQSSKLFSFFNIKIALIKSSKKLIVQSIELFANGELLAAFIKQQKNNYIFMIYKLLYKDEIKQLETPIKLNPEITFNKFIPYFNYTNEDFISNITYYVNMNQNMELDDATISRIIQITVESLQTEPTKTDLNHKERHLLDLVNEIYSTTIYIQTLLFSIQRDLNSFSNQVTYIGPFRKDPDRIYRDSESSFIDVGKNGENASMILRQSQQSRTHLLDKVSDWFLKSMGYKINIEEIENSNLFKLMVYQENTKVGNNIIDVGYGIAQVLPIVTQLLMVTSADEEIQRRIYRYDRKRTFVIEQPELHLHPAAQANLADLFVEKVIQEPNSRLLIETHSEHLVRRLQVLVANPDIRINPDDVAIYYVDKIDDGSSEVKKINLYENGQFIERWPSGFFDKSYELSRELLSFMGRGREQ